MASVSAYKRVFSAWLTVVAFVGMMVVKDYHGLFMPCDCHTHDTCACCHSGSGEDRICVLDGLPLSERGAHNHTSFLPEEKNDDDCLICHFTVVKILQARYVYCGFAATCLGSLTSFEHVFSLYTFLQHCPGRAPPFMMNN